MPQILTDPLFAQTDADAFTDRHLTALMAGTVAAVRVPGFLDPGGCATALTAIEVLPRADYDPDRVPTRIARFGPALNDHRQPDGTLDTTSYWPAAETARHAWTTAGLRPDPVGIALARLGTAWGQALTPATIGGRAVFGGTLREINAGALIHFDEVTREFPAGVFDQQVVAQLAFNLWIAAPDHGGETTVWRRRWQPADELLRDAYGYRHPVTYGAQQISLAPQAGDALLFNPTNFHAVAANLCQRRIAFAFFLALTSTGTLIYWS
jgi:hypothetical protein